MKSVKYPDTSIDLFEENSMKGIVTSNKLNLLGFSLIETMVTLAISSVITLGTCFLISHQSTDYIDTEAEGEFFILMSNMIKIISTPSQCTNSLASSGQSYTGILMPTVNIYNPRIGGPSNSVILYGAGTKYGHWQVTSIQLLASPMNSYVFISSILYKIFPTSLVAVVKRTDLPAVRAEELKRQIKIPVTLRASSVAPYAVGECYTNVSYSTEAMCKSLGWTYSNSNCTRPT
jgi:prepilin-type N-terminal cleavage/methylation domain-containing protein